jgi:hypothetical protein
MRKFMRKIIIFDEAEDAIEEAMFSADQENTPYAIVDYYGQFGVCPYKSVRSNDTVLELVNRT